MAIDIDTESISVVTRESVELFMHLWDFKSLIVSKWNRGLDFLLGTRRNWIGLILMSFYIFRKAKYMFA